MSSKYTLRPSLYSELERELNNTVFSSSLFQISLQNEQSLIEIVYLAKPRFSFSVVENPDGSPHSRNAFFSVESPGMYVLEPEKFAHESIHHARSRVNSWVKRILDDHEAALAPNTYNSKVDIEKELDDFLQKSSLQEGEVFSSDEKDRLETKLEDLEQRLAALLDEHAATQTQQHNMEHQIRLLKEAISVLDKRTFIQAAVGRVFNIVREVKAATGEVRGLLEDFQEVLPESSDSTK